MTTGDSVRGHPANEPDIDYVCDHCGWQGVKDEAISRDRGAHEDCMGQKIWMPCLVFLCPLCGHELEAV